MLAAGQAKRMEESGQHKLLAEFDGVSLVRRSAIVLLTVTGHRQGDIVKALTGLDIGTLFNPSYLTGMASSVACGILHPPIAACDGVLVMLADMPGIATEHINSVMQAFKNSGGEAIVRASFGCKPGHPVLFPQVLYARLIGLSGDVGARELIADSKLPVIMIDIGPAALLDVDTPTAIIENGGVLRD